MLALPDDILLHVLQCADEKVILNLTKISARIDKLVDNPKFWCSLLSQRTKYNEFTFCYVYNNQEIVYHKSHICKYDVGRRLLPTLSDCSRDINTLQKLWDIVQNSPTFDHFFDFNHRVLADEKVTLLFIRLRDCIHWSLHEHNLYKTFSSSVFGFYKVLLSAFNWRESCRYRGTKNCKNDTPIFSPFCVSCRTEIKVYQLLYLHPFDRLKKERYARHENIVFYKTSDNFIIFLGEDIIYCVGKLQNNEIIVDDDEINKKSFVRDNRYHDILFCPKERKCSPIKYLVL